MKNRMVISFHKYGYLRDAYPERCDSIGDMERRLEKFKQTKNIDFLVDVANFAMITYMFPPKGSFFKGTDSHESPGRIRLDNQATDERNIPVDKSVERLRYLYARGD